MSDTNTVDVATQSVATSTPAAPPTQGSDPQVSAPASEDTSANGQAKPEGQDPDKQSRRDSRAFATLRRENRDLYRRLGGMEAMLAQLSQRGEPPGDSAGTESRQTHAAQADPGADLNRSVIERISEAGDEEIEEVIEKITAKDFPINVAMRDFLATSDKPAEVARYLADHPKEAREISLLGERAADRAMERIEQKVSAKRAPKTSQAPPPVPTVGGRSTPEFDPQKASMEEYARHWRERQARR